MRLYFMRHAQAVDAEEWRGPDAMRPLTEKGRKRARLAAEGLAKLTPEVVAAIISSPYSRAYETALIVGEVIKLPVATADALRPGFSLARLDVALAIAPNAESILLVGHEPDLSAVIHALVGRERAQDTPLKKSTCVCVETPAEVDGGTNTEALAGRCALVWERTWRELAALREQ